MTVQYEGNNVYKLYLNNKEINLTLDDIYKIQTYDFEKGHIVDSIDELYDKIKELEYEKEKLYEELETLEEELKDINE